MRISVLVIVLFHLFGTTCLAQTKVKSNAISFIGDTIKKRKEDSIKVTIIKQLEDAKKAELATIDADIRRNVDRSVLISQTFSVQKDKLPKYFALIIGISSQSAKDAQRLNDILIRQYDFLPENVTLLIDSERSKVIEQMEIVKDSRDSSDNQLIFYVGRGYYDKSKDISYWLAADGNANDATTWITNRDLKEYLSAFKTKHTLLITKTAFSSSIYKEDKAEAHNNLMLFKDAYRNKSRKAMAGTGSSEADNRAFIKSLLNTLEKNQDMFLSSSELFNRIKSGLKNTTISPDIGTIQGAGDQGGDFIFIRHINYN